LQIIARPHTTHITSSSNAPITSGTQFHMLIPKIMIEEETHGQHPLYKKLPQIMPLDLSAK